MSQSRLPAVEMTLAGTTYVGQILHSALAASVVAWGYPDIARGAFISFHLEVFIFKSTTATASHLLLVLPGSGNNESVVIDLKKNILVQDSTRANVLSFMDDAPSMGVRLTFPDAACAVDFETWMHASLLEIAAEEDGVPFAKLVDLLSQELEYDAERDVFPALERLEEELKEEEKLSDD